MHCTQRKKFLIHSKIERNENRKSATFHLFWKHPKNSCVQSRRKIADVISHSIQIDKKKKPISKCAGNRVKEASRN